MTIFQTILLHQTAHHLLPTVSLILSAILLSIPTLLLLHRLDNQHLHQATKQVTKQLQQQWKVRPTKTPPPPPTRPISTPKQILQILQITQTIQQQVLIHPLPLLPLPMPVLPLLPISQSYKQNQYL